MKLKIIFVTMTCLLFFACVPSVEKTKGSGLSQSSSNVKMIDAVTWYVLSLPLEARVSQLFIAGIEGNEELHESIKQHDYAPGAFLFFSYNIADSAEKIISFTEKIANWFVSEKKSLPPLFAIDHEGGFVNRLRRIASPLPSAEEISKKLSPEQARLFYRSAGTQLAALGFHLNLAPVAEAENEVNMKFLDTRSYGTAKNVQFFVNSVIRGYEDTGISCSVKHFPGNTAEDPHFGLPRLSVSEKEFLASYLYPFRQILLNRPAAVLMSHVIVPIADDVHPACLSPILVTDIIRKTFGYDGLIISDDLYMGAMTQSGFPPEKAVVAAVEAGVTMLMLSEKNVTSSRVALLKKASEDPLFLNKINQSVIRILRFKHEVGLLQYEENKFIPSIPATASERLASFITGRTSGNMLYQEYFAKK